MFKVMLKKEILQIISSNKFAISFAVCSILILLTFFVGANSYLLSRDQYEAAVQENIRGMDGITDWRMINHRIFLPPQPLAALVNGISNDIGRNINMEGMGELRAHDSKYNEDPIYAAFRFLDLNFIFQIILSLFAVLLLYNAINGEKELGTLRLTFSNSVSRSQYILSKIVGSFSAIIIPLLIPIAIGFILLPLMGVPMTSTDWISLLGIIFSGVLYFSVFLTLSIFISASTAKSSTSFLVLLIVWIASVIVIPRASILISGRLVDVPSVDEINSKKSHYMRQISGETLSAMGNFKPTSNNDIMREFNEFMDEINTERDEKVTKFNSQVNQERRNAQMEQEKLALNLSRVSPASSFYLISSSFAGTSMELEKNYHEQAKAYQKVFADFQREKEGMTTGGGMMFIVRKAGVEENPIDPSELPEFVFKPPSLESRINSALPDLGILFVYNFIFFLVGYVKFLKFDLR